MDSTRHDLTILAVSDVARAVAFYRSAFGWTTRVEFPVYVELEEPGGRAVAFYEREAMGANLGQTSAHSERGRVTGTELYLRCEDLDAVIARLAALGAAVLRPRTLKDWGEEVAYFADPEGNVIAVAQAT